MNPTTTYASFARVIALASSLAAISVVGCAAPAEEGQTSADLSEQGAHIDIPKSERLLAQAVELAKRHAAGPACEEGVYVRTIADRVRQAIAARDTVYFRTQVIAKTPILAQELAGSLAWQEILGTFNPKKLETLPAALSAGTSLWDTNGGAYGNQERLEFRPNGQAVIFTLDVESPDYHWNEKPTTWSYDNGRLTLGTGKVFTVTYQDGMLSAKTTGEYVEWFVSNSSECEA